jgi:DnaJ-domain-containing protein 1
MRLLLAAVFVWLAWRAVKDTARGKALVRAVRGLLAPKPVHATIAPSTDDEARRVLGIAKSATDDDVRKAYRALAKTNHPDVVPEADRETAEEKMRRIQGAYDRLTKR